MKKMEKMVIICILIISTIIIRITKSSSVYDVLHSHDLPIGLFPKGVTNFSLNPQTNFFQASLNQSCSAKFETHVHYHKHISGVITHGKLSNMTGMSAQDLFLWFPVKSISVDFPTSGVVHFDVGVVKKQFSASMFENPRDCVVSDGDPPVTGLGLVRDQKHVNSIEDEQTVLRSAY